MGAKDSKPRSFEEQRILIHGLSKVFGAFMRGIRRSVGLENFPDLLKFMLKTCYTQNHDEFYFAVFPYIDRLIDEMEKSEHLEINAEYRKSKAQFAIKIKFNYPDVLNSEVLLSPAFRSLKRDKEVPSDPIPDAIETTMETMRIDDSDWKKVGKTLEDRIKADLEMIDEYDPRSELSENVRYSNKTVPVPSIELQNEDGAQKVEPCLTELEKGRERFSRNKLFGSNIHSEMNATGNSVFYDEELKSLDTPNNNSIEFLPTVPHISDGDEIIHQPEPSEFEEFIAEPDPADIISADLNFLEEQLQSLKLPLFDSAEKSLGDSFSIREEEEQFLDAVKKQKDDLAGLLRDVHDHDLSTEDLAQESQKQVDNHETTQNFEHYVAGLTSNELENHQDLDSQNPLLPQPTSSHINYDDKFASMERISREELAMKLAEQDRFYEEKLNTLRRKRREKNEDAQEEIRAIKESQNERLRLVYRK